MRRLALLVVTVCVLVSACRAGATPTPLPTATSAPTYTPYPTYTLAATATPTMAPTYTPYPTYTPLPTLTAIPTTTPLLPTETPPATETARPTDTPRPTEVSAPVARLAYTQFRADGSGYDIYAVKLDGTDKKLLVADASEPSFTRDGREVLYYDWKGSAVRIMAVDGSNKRVLIGDGEAGFANVSADKYSVIYQSGNINWERWQFDLKVYIIGIDGQGRRMITEGDQPVWHPTEMRFLCKTCDGSNCGLFVINADGSGRRMITTHANDQNATWSPDGRQIVFASDRDGNWEIYTMDSDGGNQRRLTDNPATDALPVWLPDGRQIAFRSDRGGVWSIYVMRTDGTGLSKVVDARCSERWRFERMAVFPR